MVNRSGKPWRYWCLSIVAIAVLLTGISGCEQLPSISQQSSISQANHILAFVPKQALLSAVINTTTKLDKARTHTHLSKVVSKNLDALLVSFSLNFKDDIRPWLGDTLAVAITDKDIDRDPRNGRQTGYLLVVDAADGDRLREFLELFWQRQTVAGIPPVLSKASGVPVVTGQVGTNEQSLATAVVGQHILLVANDTQVLKQSLRVAQTPTLQLLKYDCCVPAWVNLQLPALVDWLGLAVPVQQRLPSSPQWQQLITTAVAQPHRLVINTRAKSLNRQTAAPIFTANLANTNPQSVESIESYLPASLVWAAAGYDLRSLWVQVENELNYYHKLPAPIQQSQQWLSTQLAQTLIEPITQLFSNAYAIGQFRDGTWLMAIANSQSASVKQLDNIAIQQGLTVSQFTLKDQSVTAWSRLKTLVNEGAHRETTVETELVALHTKAKDCHIFATSISGLTAALEAPEHPLLDTPRFQKAMQPINQSNHQGYLYGTWDEIERLLASDRWFSLVKPILQPWTESLSAIAVSTHEQPDEQSTGIISILLKD